MRRSQSCSLITTHFPFIFKIVRASQVHRKKSALGKLVWQRSILVKFKWAIEAAHCAVQFRILSHIAPSCNTYCGYSKAIGARIIDIWTQNVLLMGRRLGLTISWTCKWSSHLNCVEILNGLLILLVEIWIPPLTCFILIGSLTFLIFSIAFDRITTIIIIWWCFKYLITWFSDWFNDSHYFLLFHIIKSLRVIRSYHWLSVLYSYNMRNLRSHHRKLFAFIYAHFSIQTCGLYFCRVTSE